eukprot:TRINITY_DN13654_c0_g1_i1.p1 TRINITY_DN13654_c0_g1~~TRINITY_DN13654_c0_g1_i1.p1  ORF type:complete len:121 (-),score=18.78 TRINITY_DN13654_c0_g1_i1:27-389(-)
MKLLTHNMLQSNVRDVKKPYPLLIKATKVELLEVPYEAELVKAMIPKIEYSVVVEAATSLGYNDLPKQLPTTLEEEFLKKLHHALFKIDVVEGELICPESKRSFPITNGIPNMLLTEDEL